MDNAWRMLITPPAGGAWNMALDETLLEQVGRGDSAPVLRLYGWQPPCLSLGYAQPFSDVDPSRLAFLGWEVVRRLTGGRAILHTDELTYAVLLPMDNPLAAGGVLESYNRLAQALLDALLRLGVPAELKHLDGGGHGSMNPICFETPSTFEVLVNGKKLVGSAQARRKDALLQHGSLPLSGDIRRIVQALVFNDETDRFSAGQRMAEKAITMEGAIGACPPWAVVAQAIVDAFSDRFRISFSSSSLTVASIDRHGLSKATRICSSVR